MGFATTAAFLRQKTIMAEDETMDDVVEKTKGKQGDSMMGVLSAQRAQEAVDANYKLAKLNPDQLNAAVRHFTQEAGQPVGAELSMMSDREKRELIMKSTSTKKLDDYFKNEVKMPELLAGTPAPLAAPYKPSIRMSIAQVSGFYKEWWCKAPEGHSLARDPEQGCDTEECRHIRRSARRDALVLRPAEGSRQAPSLRTCLREGSPTGRLWTISRRTPGRTRHKDQQGYAVLCSELPMDSLSSLVSIPSLAITLSFST